MLPLVPTMRHDCCCLLWSPFLMYRYDVTEALPTAFDGSEDGMHFGLLANQEKLQRILAYACGGEHPASSSSSHKEL